MADRSGQDVETRGHEENGPSRTGGSAWVNVSDPERIASAVGGGILALLGLSRRSLGGLGLAALGGALLYRGASGHCNVYKALGHSTAHRGASNSVPSGRGVKVEKTFTINRRPDELYLFWSDLTNIPRVMKHIEKVEVLDQGRSHWVVRGPGDARFEWDAIIVNQIENELIAWRSLEGAQVANAGSVHFKKAPGGRGAEMKVVLRYDPPGGRAGVALAKMFAQDPARQLEEELRHFKQLMEAGEVPRVEGERPHPTPA